MRERAIVIAAAVVAIVVAVVLTAGGGSQHKGSAQPGGKPAAGAIHVSFSYSPEKQALLEPLVAKFNAERHDARGHAIYVDAAPASSGDAEDGIAKGKSKPVVWSPSSSLWGRLLNFDADRHWVAPDNPSIVRTPLVIAMWEPLARALGWPRRQVSFADVLKLALDKRGWAAYGKPEYGAFKLGHTNPDFSTSGLSAVAAEYYAATGKREGLTEADVTTPAVRRKIQGIENSVVHYGDTTLFFADQLKRYGPAYASAVAMEEVTLIDFNRNRSGTKLVGLYPKEGTFFSDDPYLVLDAPWVTAAQHDAAQTFGKWLTDHVTPQLAAKAGFRPGDPGAKPLAPVDAAHGADPAEPRRVLSLPEPRVLARLKRAWHADRKPANVELVVDTSGSMGEENKLDQAKRGLGVFLRQLSPRDRVGLVSFNDRISQLVPVLPFSQGRGRLEAAVRDLFPDGQTAVYDATGEGLRTIQSLHDGSRINAVVVLTDGQDNQSNSTADELARRLAAQSRSEGLTVRVYTIAYGSQANETALKQIADAAGGKEFKGDPTQIESVYRSISSFF